MSLNVLKILSIILSKVGGYCLKKAGRLYQTIQQKRVQKWFTDNSDKSLRLNYDINAESIVFDVGGYEGQWASDIFAMYYCTIFIFEPVLEYANKIEKRFSKNKNIFVYKYGLSNRNMVNKMSICKDESSMYITSKNAINSHFKRAVDFIKDNKIEKIDLMKINIEGGEYDLLEDLIEARMIHQIKNIQVQFHDFVPNAEARMLKIQENLERTHYLTYQYPFVWENWHLK